MSYISSGDFEVRMSGCLDQSRTREGPLTGGPHVACRFSVAYLWLCRMSNFGNSGIALSNLGVKGH